MTFTPTMKGSFLAGIGLWLMLWLGLFKLDEVVQDTPLRRFASSEGCFRWISLALLKDIYPWRTSWDAMALHQIVPAEAQGKRVRRVREKHLNPLRVGIAHALLKTGEVRITLDKIDHIQQVNKWLPLCRVLARLMLRNEFPQEFALMMKPLSLPVVAR